ncbi:MAG: hypothetical protein NTX61_06190 [Bacteroidetes bacterium]|nr:hypothetical protein [Bacteroidota bacterium]
MNDGTIQVREVLNAIANLDNLSSSLLGKGKTYDTVLKEVLAHKGSLERWPKMKDFDEKFKLKPGNARKLLDQIYKDLMELVCDYDNPKYIIKNVVHHIYVQYFDRSFNIMCKLPVTPSIGDWVDFPFLHAAVGSSYFHVSRVHHEFDGETQTITIWLERGQFNFYKRFNEDKLEYEKEERWRKQIKMGNI